MKNQIGLDKKYADDMAEKLNLLLSNVQVFYQNVRGYHWNVVGRQFFQLHEKFEGIYNDLNEKADEIAERILMLEGTPIHAFSKYLKTASFKEKENVSGFEETVTDILQSMQELVVQEREILVMASEAGDEGTVSLISGYIEEQEKLIWMLNAVLK